MSRFLLGTKQITHVLALLAGPLLTFSVVNAGSNPHIVKRKENSYTPVAYLIGTAPTIDGLLPYSATQVTLDASNPVLTLDYGAEVAGYPYVEISSLATAGTQLNLKYSEPFNGLDLEYSDGPFLFASGLANSFRTETFNISSPGLTTSFFIQGGQRWQTITLLSNSSITISSVGFRASVDIIPNDSLPGALSVSNSIYGDVWSIGARSLQTACVEADSQPSTWEVSSEGALIRGQYPGVSALGVKFGSYTMSFKTKIVSGGTGWRVAGGANGGYGPYFVLVSGGPHLLNANQELLPPNTLVAGYGFSIINEAILSSAPPQYFELPEPILENEWYDITTTIGTTGYNISINGTINVFVSNEPFRGWVNPTWGSSTLTDGTFGFGPFLDQSAWFKDVVVVGQDGTSLYTNSLTTDEVYGEYGMAQNARSVCLDGAKRDRMNWIGDFVHTARMLATSTGRFDFIQSMIQLEFDWQFLDGPAAGLVPIQSPLGAQEQYKDAYYPSEFNQQDYFIFFLVTLGDYYILTSDTELLGQHWSGTKFLVDTIISRYLDPVSGLMAANDAFWFTAQGTQNATAPTALLAIALNQLVHVAEALDDNVTAQKYRDLSADLNSSINSQLWSPTLGAYSMSLELPGDTAILATAYTIRAGTANTSQATSSLEKLSDLFYEIGYKDSTRIGNGATTQLSPNVQGFLLESLFLAHTQLNVSSSIINPILENLLDVFWPRMTDQNEYYTGAPWEYLYPDGSPGIGIFTSLNHPWGGAPTYILTDYVLGVRRELDEETNTYAWVFDPAWEIVEGLGLTWVKGKVPLFGGGWIEASWSLENGNVDMTADVKEAAGVNVKVKQRV